MNNNMSTHINQEPALPANNEEVIHMLGLDGFNGSNAGKLVDDIVRELDLNSFTYLPSGEPVAAIGFESVQGHHQILGNPLEHYQTIETISYVDLSPVSPYGVSENNNSPYNSPQRIGTSSSPYHVSNAGASPPPYPSQELMIDTITPPASPQEVSYTAPPSPAVVNNQSTAAAGGKAPRRRREPTQKLYQREEPLLNPEEEKKRLNAINAKKNRDKQKNRLQELEILVKSLTDERDTLKASNIKLKKKSDTFETQLRSVCQQFNVPVIILPQD